MIGGSVPGPGYSHQRTYMALNWAFTPEEACILTWTLMPGIVTSFVTFLHMVQVVKRGSTSSP